jgi:DNA polymerase epsilon subunit 2
VQVFRKYSHSLGPDALAFLEDVLARHEVADADVEQSIEFLAQEYNKQDGSLLVARAPHDLAHGRTDAQMKVALPVLERVYEAMQGAAARDDRGPTARDALDPDAHLFFVDAFDMPAWHWSVERSTFEKSAPSLHSAS